MITEKSLILGGGSPPAADYVRGPGGVSHFFGNIGLFQSIFMRLIIDVDDIWGIESVTHIFSSKLNIELNFSYGLGMGTSVLYSKYQKTVVRCMGEWLIDSFK